MTMWSKMVLIILNDFIRQKHTNVLFEIIFNKTFVWVEYNQKMPYCDCKMLSKKAEETYGLFS